MSELRCLLTWRVLCLLAVIPLSVGGGALFGVCGPFTDVQDVNFCPFVLEAFTLGITTGTTPTTYSPNDPVTRLQMAAFLSRGVDRILQRGSPRAALGRSWTPAGPPSLGLTTVGSEPHFCACDGADVWVVNALGPSVSRVRASDGRLLENWTGAGLAYAPLVAPGGIFIISQDSPAALYRIDPSQPPGAATAVVSNLGDDSAHGITFDGGRFWTANLASVSIVTPGPSLPWTVTVAATALSRPEGALFDGTNVWITEFDGGILRKLDANGSILQTVTLGTHPEFPVFDGSNIWVPVSGVDSMAVVRASSGVVLATLTGNGMNDPVTAAFDGQRILVTNILGNSVSLWKAADLTPLGSVPTGSATTPVGACSDGANFWITLLSSNKLARF